MTADDLESYLSASLRLTVERITGADGQSYTMVRDFVIPRGSLRDRRCDVALLRVETVPYNVPAAIHTRPALVPMSSGAPLATQASGIGPDWQYWSRRFDRQPTPQAIWAHVVTVLTEDSWAAA